MGKLLHSLETIERTERLVDLLELRSQWNAGVFNGCIYEHMLPVFDSTYRHLVKPFTRPGEYAERNRLERSINEVFGKNTRGYSVSPPHKCMLELTSRYAFEQRSFLEYPITEWTKDELFKEYDTSFFWSSVWGIIGVGASAADASKLVMETVAFIIAAKTAVRFAGAAGATITIAGVAAAALTYYYFTRERDKIREEINNRIDNGDITGDEWDKYDLEVMRRYVS